MNTTHATDEELLSELRARGVIRQRGAPRKPVVRESLTVRITPGLRAWVDSQPGSASRVVERALLAAQVAASDSQPSDA